MDENYILTKMEASQLQSLIDAIENGGGGGGGGTTTQEYYYNDTKQDFKEVIIYKQVTFSNGELLFDFTPYIPTGYNYQCCTLCEPVNASAYPIQLYTWKAGNTSKNQWFAAQDRGSWYSGTLNVVFRILCIK